MLCCAICKALKIWVDIFNGVWTLNSEKEITSYISKKFTMVLTNDAIQMRWIFLLKCKNEMLKYMWIFNQFIKNLLSYGMAILHSDYGEFNFKAATAYMLSERIKWESISFNTF